MDKQLQIIIIDDEPIVGKRLKQALTNFGTEVEVFEDSAEAVNRLKEKRFDIVVTDVHMDNVDGIQILEHQKECCEHSKVIIITGYATIEVAQEAMVKGAFDFIVKPFKPDDLRKVINKAALSLGLDSSMPI
jgi:DNA-binding NtrC family response regulator